MVEASLREDTLMRILVIGLARELPLAPADAMDIADKLVARAANAHTEGIEIVIIKKVKMNHFTCVRNNDIIPFRVNIFNMCIIVCAL